MTTTSPLPALAAVVAVGARTPLGLEACQTGFLFRAGFATMEPTDVGLEGGEITACRQTVLAEDRFGVERAVALATPALDEALGALGTSEPLRAKLILSLDRRREGDAEALADQLFARCRARLASCKLMLIHGGEAGPCHALPAALSSLAAGEIDVVLLGGVHSDIDPLAIATLAEEGRLYDHDNLDSVIPGESAAFVALAAAATARRLGIQPRAWLCGLGAGIEPARRDNDLVTGPARAFTAALRQASAPLEERDLRAGWLLTTMGLEAWNLPEWQALHVRASNVLGPPHRYDSPAQRIGTVGGAAAPLFITLVAEGFARGYAPSPLALLLLASDSGERGALVLQRG